MWIPPASPTQGLMSHAAETETENKTEHIYVSHGTNGSGAEPITHLDHLKPNSAAL